MVTILGPYLTGPAQVVLRTTPAQDALDYQRVKATIVDRYEVTEGTQKHCFSGLHYHPSDQPKALIAKLKEYATRRLKPQMPGKRAIIDKVVLEQVFQAIPSPVRAWLMRKGPTSLDQATTHLENYFLAERSTRPEGLGIDKARGRGRGRALVEECPREPKPSRTGPSMGIGRRPLFQGQLMGG